MLTHHRSNAEAPPYSAAALPAGHLDLRLRYRKLAARSEIHSVGLSSDARRPVAYATFNGGQMDQVWLDMFELDSQRGLSKVPGSHAAFAPGPGTGTTTTTRVATLRDWTVQLGPGVDYSHSTSLLVRDVATGKSLLEIKGACGEPVAWSPDGRLVAAAEPRRHRIGVWDARSGQLRGRVVSHIDSVAFAAFTHDAQPQLVTAARDGTLRLTDPATSRTVARLEIEGLGAGNPRALAVAREGSTGPVVVSVWGATVHVWRPRAGQVASYALAAVRRTEGVPLTLSPDARYMLCWTEGGGFDIMDARTGTTLAERPGGALVTAAAFSADASVLLLGRMDGYLEVWDIVTKS
ncbi:Quinoprotein amine dehydrogenase [Cordyceps fumosorosea ARSEF 2679]|uniref:Quinoprotein amine dehydrogenase n=1 Tax=Cordyceps fumosorosea (strain ARSEF 2679) TaxID=1081104 RepID=A0A167PBP6_CORFA|nr:Quinoprotein amine dehydrogenase [Cordyceps fumosorosea ARSEF 2679]OAA56493.1 Quinoprotein amine dehydrogenase [Cordyceps fumosorosea ARSEF 2679]